MTEKLRVAVIDDDIMVRSALGNYLAVADDMEVTLSTARPEEVIAAASRDELDIVITDVQMPGMDGIELTSRLKEVAPKLPVLVLTTFDLDDHMLGALSAGASGFLLKDVDPQGLLNSVRVAVSGGRVVAPAPVQRLVHRAVSEESETRPSKSPESLGLTERELTVVREMCRGLGNREIAKALHLSEATIKSYVSAIMQKMGVNSRTLAVIEALRAGVADLD